MCCKLIRIVINSNIVIEIAIQFDYFMDIISNLANHINITLINTYGIVRTCGKKTNENENRKRKRENNKSITNIVI